MADNPFYPGYMPDPDKYPQDAKSPFYFGYYPGERGPPVPRLPSYAQPFEFNFDDIIQVINQVEAEMGLVTSGLPMWVYERIVDDFKGKLKASYQPGGATGFDVTTLDEFDPEGMPGAFGLTISLNPVPWFQDPIKQAKKELRSIAKSALNWTDLETRNRVQIWNQVILDNPQKEFEDAGIFLWPQARQETVNRTARRFFQNFGAGTNPLALNNRGIIKQGKSVVIGGATYTMTDDVYEIVGKQIIEFQKSSGFRTSRSKAYDKFLTAAVEAINEDLKQNQASVNALGADYKKAFEVFSKKAEILDKMEVLRKSYSESIASVGMVGVLKNYALDGSFDISMPVQSKNVKDYANGIRPFNSSLADDLDRWADSNDYKDKEKIKQHFKNLDPKERAQVWAQRVDFELESYTKGLEARKQELKDAVDFVRTNYGDKEADRLKKQFRHYSNYLDKMEKHAGDVKKAIKGKKFDRVRALRAAEKFDSIANGGLSGRGLAGGGFFVNGLKRQLAQDLVEVDFLKPKIGKEITMFEVANGLSGDLHERLLALRAYSHRLQYEKDMFDFDDFLSLVERGNILETFVWNRIRSRIEVFTPGYWVQRFLKNNHYFGLVLKSDKSFSKSLVYRLDNMFRRNKDDWADVNIAPGRAFGNWFDLGFKYKDSATGKMIKVSGKIFGGRQFDGLSGFRKMRKLVKSGEWTEAVFEKVLSTPISDIDFGNAAFIASLQAANGGNPVTIPTDNLDRFSLNIRRMKLWVEKNKKLFKGKVDTNDPAFWHGFIENLSKIEQSYGAEITRKYAGYLERLTVRLNMIQTKIFETKLFQKLILPVSNIKKVVSEFVADKVTWLIQKGLNMAIGAATGGVGSAVMAVVEKVLRPLIRFVVKKTTDFAQNVVWEGLVKGNYLKAFQSMEKSILGLIKIFVTISAVPLVAMLVVSQTFLGTVLSSISPVDPTRSSSHIAASAFNCIPPGGSCVAGPVDHCCLGARCDAGTCNLCAVDGGSARDDCSNCCSGVCTGPPGSKICQGDVTRPPPGVPPGTSPPPPAGYFGDGAGCSGTFPVLCDPGNPGDPGIEYPCHHGDADRQAVDIFAPDGTALVAPFDGESSPYDDGVGGASIVFFPDDPSGDYQDNITSPCPSFYFTHLRYTGRVSGPVSRGQVIGLVSDTGNAAGLPHVHTAADTDGVFPGGRGDVDVISLLEGWGYPCTTPWNSSADTTCF